MTLPAPAAAPPGAPPLAAALDAALLDAATAGRLAELDALLAADPDAAARARDAAGDRGVIAAAFRGQRAAAERVAGAIGAAQLDPWESALLGETGTLAAHLDADPGLVARPRHDGWPLLHLAGFYGRPAVVDLVAARGADVHARSSNAIANTALGAVFAMSGDLATAERLLAAGADPNAPGGGGYTPLHLAASRGHQAGIALLLARGADPAACTGDGRTPAAIARERGHAAAAAQLDAAVGAG